MIWRFTGTDGRRLLIACLRDQPLLHGDEALVEAVADVVEIDELRGGQVLFAQGATDNDMAFVLSGRLDIVVNGRRIATRRERQHVGEMALIDPSATRSARVVADGTCIVARVAEPDFTRVAESHPELWRRLACALAERLRQRNDLVIERNLVPHLFVGSSAEQYPVAEAISLALKAPTLDIATWKMGIFRPSGFTLPDLEAEASRSDYAVLVLAADDLVTSRRRKQLAPRDNVILELGLFIGACGHDRVFLLVPDGVDIKIPTDLLGITTVRFTPATRRTTLDVSGAAAEIAVVVQRLGSR